MQDLKEIHQRIRQKKKEHKDIKIVYQDVLKASKNYQDLLEELNKLRVKKCQLAQTLQEQCAHEMEQAERLALDIKTDMQVLSDVAMIKFMKGETIELTDENDVKYEPVFKVTFKKIG